MVKDGKFKGNFFKKLIKDEYYRSVEYLKQFSWSECKYELKSTLHYYEDLMMIFVWLKNWLKSTNSY